MAGIKDKGGAVCRCLGDKLDFIKRPSRAYDIILTYRANIIYYFCGPSRNFLAAEPLIVILLPSSFFFTT